MSYRTLAIAVCLTALARSAAAQDATVRFINASPPDLAYVYLTVDDSISYQVDYARSSERFAVSPGTHTIRAKGTTAVLKETSVTFAGGKYYTAVLFGTLAPPSNYDFVIAEDEGKPEDQKIQLRYGLFSKILSENPNASDLKVTVGCDHGPSFSLTVAPMTISEYRPQTAGNWPGGVCPLRLIKTVTDAGGQMHDETLFEDAASYVFSPNVSYTIAVIAYSLDDIHVVREVDNPPMVQR